MIPDIELIGKPVSKFLGEDERPRQVSSGRRLVPIRDWDKRVKAIIEIGFIHDTFEKPISCYLRSSLVEKAPNPSNGKVAVATKGPAFHGLYNVAAAIVIVCPSSGNAR